MERPVDPKSLITWLIEFRWAMLVAQVVGTVIAVGAPTVSLHGSPPYVWLLLLFGAYIGVNITLIYLRSSHHSLPRTTSLFILLYDVISLTLLFLVTGGSSNPFTLFYLAEITLGITVLGFQHSIPIWTLSNLGFLSLFLFAEGGHHGHSSLPVQNHLVGMFIAFFITGVLIAYFLRKHSLETALFERNREELKRNREEQLRLATLTALASQTAHEFGTPLGTITIAVDELIRKLTGRIDASEEQDLSLIESQCQKLKLLLEEMAVKGGVHQGEGFRVFVLRELQDGLERELRQFREFCGVSQPDLMIDVGISGDDARLFGPFQRILHAVHSLVRNSIAAQATSITVSLCRGFCGVEISVEDDGIGMSSNLLSRVGKPFLKAQDGDSGMGLGLFVVKLLCEHLGGVFSIRSERGKGTKVVLSLPIVDNEIIGEKNNSFVA